MELRHNERCKGKPPQLLFTTKTKGRWDRGQFGDVAELPIRAEWTVTAQETGWLIEQKEFGISHTFNYRRSHQLSDIYRVRLYAHKGCGVDDTGFTGEVSIAQKVPEFSKITVQAGCSNQLYSTGIFFSIDNVHSGVSLYGTTVIYFGPGGVYGKFVLDDPVTEDTTVTAVLEHIEGDQYQFSGIVGDKTFNALLTQTGKDGWVKFHYFSDIQKIEIECNIISSIMI